MMRRAVRLAAGCVALAIATAVGCSEIGTDPNVPAAIEFAPLPYPSVALGDSLRDTAGVAQPVRAIVRNVRGDIIPDAEIRYLYVQFPRDSALVVDSATGHVVASRTPSGGQVQIAARSGLNLQVLREIRVSRQPDTVFSTQVDTSLRTVLPDTGQIGADANSVPVSVTVQYADSTETLRNAGDWLVRFRLLRPANLANDTTLSVFLVNDQGRPSTLDTTAANGVAARRVRVRAGQFPLGAELDSVLVEAVVFRRGEPVPGSPVTLKAFIAPPGFGGPP